MDVHQLWQECATKRVSEVARRNGLTTQKLVALFDQSGLTGRQPSDPGPEEIARATAQIRLEWKPETERNRWIASRRSAGWS